MCKEPYYRLAVPVVFAHEPKSPRPVESRVGNLQTDPVLVRVDLLESVVEQFLQKLGVEHERVVALVNVLEPHVEAHGVRGEPRNALVVGLKEI